MFWGTQCEISHVPARLLYETCHGRSSQTPVQTPAETNGLASKTQQLPSPNKRTMCKFFILWPREDLEESLEVSLFPQDFCVCGFALSSVVDAGSGHAASLSAPAAAILPWEHHTRVRVLCQESWITSAMRSRVSINLSVSSHGIYVVKGDKALVPRNCEPAREGFLLCEGLIS